MLKTWHDIRGLIPTSLPVLRRARIERRACEKLGVPSRFDLLAGSGLCVGFVFVALAFATGLMALAWLAAAAFCITLLAWAAWYCDWR